MLKKFWNPSYYKSSNLKLPIFGSIDIVLLLQNLRRAAFLLYIHFTASIVAIIGVLDLPHRCFGWLTVTDLSSKLTSRLS